MRKLIFILALLISAFLVSCEDSFSPYAPFTADYILNGIIRGDTSYQVITLSKSYQPDGPDPLGYKQDPAITGARIEIYYDNMVFALRDSSITRMDTIHFNTPFSFYYLKDFKPGINKKISIKAFLPDGTSLEASTITPSISFADFIREDNFGYDFPPDTGRSLIIRWNDKGPYSYDPDINLNYKVDGDSVLHKIALPLRYDERGAPVYSMPERDNFIVIDTSSIGKTLGALVAKYGGKSGIKIKNITMDLLVYDEDLSAYYSSLEFGLNGFTVRIDDPDFTNVKGGLGIFGSYVSTRFTTDIDDQYLKKLGFEKIK